MSFNHQQLAQTPAQMAIQFWVIWFALLPGMVIIMMFAGGGWPSGEDATSWTNPLIFVPLGALIVSLFVRMVMLPKAPTSEAKLPIAVVGMALGEGAAIIAMFVFPKEYVLARQLFYVLGFLAVCSYIPLYLHRKPSRLRDFTKSDSPSA